MEPKAATCEWRHFLAYRTARILFSDYCILCYIETYCPTSIALATMINNISRFYVYEYNLSKPRGILYFY